MKIDWKKEISLPKRRREGSTSKPSRRSINGPDISVPKPLADLYADLRDRRLLPVVGLLIVAIIAAPILLSGKGGHEEPIPEVGAIPTAEGGASQGDFSVVPAATGLRDYKKRLAHREALNPFRQPHGATQAPTSPEGESAASGQSGEPGSESGSSESGGEPRASSSFESGEETVTVEVGGVTKEVPVSTVEKESEKENGKETAGGKKPAHHEASEPTEAESTPAEEKTETSTPGESSTPKSPAHPDEPSNGGSGDKGSDSTPAAQPEVVGFTIAAEVGFVPHTSEKTKIAPMTKLPNAKHPVVLYLGLSKDHKRALFLMTSNVTAYYGGHCALDKQACQLVEVKPGKGVTFAYGYGDSRYKVHLKRIVPTVKG